MPTRIFVVLICILLGACSQNKKIQSDIDSLAERLESYTELPLKPYDRNMSLDAPQKHTLEHKIEELQIAMREFYAIDDCPLGQFIAERNTSLGKTQLPSTRFIYEKRLLTTLDSCQQQLDLEHPMLNALQSWIDHKQANLPLVWSNMVTQSDEFYLAFTTAGGFISGESDDGLSATKLALNHINTVLNSAEINSEQLELHLRDLSNTRLPAKMWRTQQLLTHSLPPMSELLTEYVNTNSNSCSASKKEELKIMRNIFSMFFADKIQPLASQLNHYQYQLNPNFEKLANSPHVPRAWAEYINSQYIASAGLYKQQMQQHIELWQQIFKLCE